MSSTPRPGIVAIIAVALILITSALLITPASASTSSIIIDERLHHPWFDTSGNGTQVSSDNWGAGYQELRNLGFKNIENHQLLSYIVIDTPKVLGQWDNGSTMAEGRYDLTYIYDGITKPAVVYISRPIFGGTKITIFLNDWDIGDKKGSQIVTLPGWRFTKTDTARDGITQPPVYMVGNPKGVNAKITWVSANDWYTDVLISEDDVGYDIRVNRTVNGVPYETNVTILGPSGLLDSEKSVGGVTEWWYPKTGGPYTLKINHPHGTAKEYRFGAVDPTPPAAPVTVYVKRSDTGALITDAHLTILDSHAGSTPAVDQDLPAGTGTFNLEKADTLRYHASATADGYTLLSPILFGVGDDGATIVLWMAPDAPPDDPIEEGKSMLYGYILTQGSQQPISGATVSLNGHGSTTTSSTGFYLFNNVTPGSYSISASAPLHDALSESVTVDATATQHNLALTGHYLLTVTVKDGDTLANIQNATISLSDGQESTQNPATFTADYGPYTITAAAGGYYPQTQSAYLDKPGTTTATVLLTARPEPVPPPEMPNYPPHNVKFTVKTLLGTPIPGVTVTAQGIQQTPSTNIIERLLGINMTSTPITTELMSGTTDSNGEINFMMIEAVKYQITIKKPGVVDQTLEIYPKEDTYPIIISTAGGPLLPDAGDALRDIHINITTSTGGDIGHIHIDYNDTTLKTTSLTIQVTQQNTTNTSAPEDVIASHTVANDANVTHTFNLPNYKGQSFFVRLEAEHPDFGTINRDYAVAFKGVRVPLGPLPDGLYIYVAGFGLMLLGGIFGATSATRGVVVIAFAGWLFYAFGWLDDLGLIAPVSLGLVSTIAVMGVIVTRYREEGYQ